MPQNRVNVDTLHQRLYGGMRIHISSKTEAYRIAQEALDKGMVFGYQREKKPLLFDYVRTFWNFSTSPYVRKKFIEGSSITKMQCSKMLGTFENHCKGCLNENMRLDAFKVSDMERIKSAMYDKGLRQYEVTS